MLVSRRGALDRVPACTSRLRALRRARRRADGAAGWPRVATRMRCAAPRLRAALLPAVVARTPSACPAPLSPRSSRGRGQAGFLDALDALTNYPIRDRLPEIALPTLIVWGANDRLVPVRDADEFERLIPQRAQGGLRATPATCAMLERPARVQRAARGVPRETAAERAA